MGLIEPFLGALTDGGHYRAVITYQTDRHGCRFGLISTRLPSVCIWAASPALCGIPCTRSNCRLGYGPCSSAAAAQGCGGCQSPIAVVAFDSRVSHRS